jgi:16S rRNA (guanine966-N2)-methyltransferase
MPTAHISKFIFQTYLPPMSLSLTGGQFNGAVLKTPTGMNLTRPTSGKVRQALFNILRGEFEDEGFLDLYAGSGAVGLEALSRGARRVTLVEHHSAAFRVLEGNVKLLIERGAEAARIESVRQDARSFCASLAATKGGQRFAVVFADPPFGQDFSGLWDLMRPLVAPGGFAIVQYPSRTPPGFTAQADRIVAYGESSLAVFRVSAGPTPPELPPSM